MKSLVRIGRGAVRRVRASIRAFWQALLGCEVSSRSYSQYGEDMVLKAVFARYPSGYSGCYVDVGAHHPLKFSNSRFFYERGWSGICIDPLPGAAALFARWRPRDTFLQLGVGVTEGELTYFMFDSAAHNTFSEKVARECGQRETAREKVKVLPLRQILAEHVSAGRDIDFLSVDAEGMDLPVLCSNDWARYRPRVVVVEETSASVLADVENLEVAQFMNTQGYRAFARTPSGLFFIDTRSTAYDGGCYLQCLSNK